tara:strand:+ start:933 stop:1046 length:114 start_codon:yes stop_codon:yes gene_type:complete
VRKLKNTAKTDADLTLITSEAGIASSMDAVKELIREG